MRMLEGNRVPTVVRNSLTTHLAASLMAYYVNGNLLKATIPDEFGKSTNGVLVSTIVSPHRRESRKTMTCLVTVDYYVTPAGCSTCLQVPVYCIAWKSVVVY